MHLRLSMMIVAMAAAPAEAQNLSCENYQAMRDLQRVLAGAAKTCVASNARKMAKGPDAASDIAIAALETCNTKIAAIKDDCVGSALIMDRYVDEFRREAIRVVVATRTP